MYLKHVGFFVLWTHLVNCDILENKMEAEGVVPDVIDKSPSAILQVIYAGNVHVNLGDELTPTQVKDPPTVDWPVDAADVHYTLAMVDPDAPDRRDPKYREVNHWLVGNIAGADLTTGDVIAEYLGSGPPKGTGLHRYVFLLYRQEKKLEFDEPKTGKLSRAHRLNFNVRKFAEKYELGEPIAGNFFQAQWDPYVDVRAKNITNN